MCSGKRRGGLWRGMEGRSSGERSSDGQAKDSTPTSDRRACSDHRCDGWERGRQSLRQYPTGLLRVAYRKASDERHREGKRGRALTLSSKAARQAEGISYETRRVNTTAGPWLTSQTPCPDRTSPTNEPVNACTCERPRHGG